MVGYISKLFSARPVFANENPDSPLSTYTLSVRYFVDVVGMSLEGERDGGGEGRERGS